MKGEVCTGHEDSFGSPGSCRLWAAFACLTRNLERDRQFRQKKAVTNGWLFRPSQFACYVCISLASNQGKKRVRKGSIKTGCVCTRIRCASFPCEQPLGSGSG